MVIHSALLDFSTNVVLAISPRVFAIEFLSECMPDTLHAPFVHHPNYVHSAFFASLTPEDWPSLTWDLRERKFVDTPASVATEQLRCRARLAAGKLDVIERITDNLNVARYKLRTGVDHQDVVYLNKRREAKKLRNSQYDEEIVGDCPFVAQYADYANVSLQQATEDILLKAK